MSVFGHLIRCAAALLHRMKNMKNIMSLRLGFKYFTSVTSKMMVFFTFWEPSRCFWVVFEREKV